MKILEIIQTLASGGAERLVVDLCNELSKTEDVTILLLKDADHYYLPQLSEKVKVIKAQIPVGFSFSQMFRCVKLIKQIDPDVVHVHSHARYNILLANLWLRNKYRFYMTIHSDVELHYSKGISGLQVRLSGFVGKSKFVTISDINYQQFCRCHPRLKQKKILNGRALPSLSDKYTEVVEEIKKYKTNNETKIFIHVARFHPCKNQKLLVKAFNELIESGENISLVLIGANYDSVEGKRLQEISNDHIQFLGTRTNIYDYLACSDAFCLSSDYEGMPMSLIEAMLSGLPMISTPVCGALDVITNGKNGFVSKSHSLEDYKNAIKSFLNKYEEISSFAKFNKDKSLYTISNCAKEYVEWFKII